VDAYYNPANPSQPYSGPANSGAAQFNTITQTVNLVLTAGTPTSGTPTLPATPAGAVALYSIYVAGGATSIVAGNITALPSAPFAPFQAPLQYLTPGTKNLAVYIPTNQGNWTVPNGISKIRVRMWGGGGAGGPGSGGAGGGGGAGGYTEGYLTVTPGNQYFVTVGGGGVGAGTPGGGSSFASLMTVLGGSGGGAGSSGTNTIGSGGAGAAVGTGGNILIAGNAGGDGVCFSTSGIGMGGTGGGAHSGDGAAGIIGIVTSPRDGHSVATVGGGGGGAIGSGLGGQGGPGLVLIEW
jgi:hypothetical protein